MDKLHDKGNSDINGNRTKVLIIVYYWPPSGGAGVQRWVKLTKYLTRLGLEVFVITVDENYASYMQVDKSLSSEVSPDIKVIKTRSFEVINLFAKLFGKKKVPTAGFYNLDKKSLTQNLGMLIRSNLFIPDPRRGWNQYAYREAVRLIKTEKIRTVITSTPPHSSQLIGLKLKKRLKINWVADLRDPWTDIYYYKILRHSFFSRWIDRKYEQRVLTKADRIITVSDHLKELFAQKGPAVDPSKIHIIPNGFDDEDFTAKRSRDLKDSFTICYTGAMTDQYEPRIFLEAFKDLIHKHPGRVKLQLVGNISSQVLKDIEQMGMAEAVEAIPTLPHQKAIEHMINADALLLLIPNVDHAELILTGKLFEYLAAGKPIILIGPEGGDAARIIRECKAGACFERESGEKLLQYLEGLWNKHARGEFIESDHQAIRKYSRKEQAERVKDIITW